MPTVLAFFITLSVLILTHELGHFWAAKKGGIKVEEFGFGYPPRVWAKKIGETVYSFNLLPFGGFVRLFGEEQKNCYHALEHGSKFKRAFWAKRKRTRLAVILGGIGANFVLAVVCFSTIYSALGVPVKTNQIRVVGVAPNSPAEKAGLQENDLILLVDGQRLKDLDRFIEWVAKKKGEEIEIKVKREEEELSFQLIPRKEPPQGEGPLGVVITNIEMKKYPFWQRPWRGTFYGFKEAFVWTGLIGDALGKMLANLFQGKLPQDVVGPVGIFQLTSGVAQKGGLAVLQFMGILSVNLAVLNFVPFPGLDGGRLWFLVYEFLTRKKPHPKIERWINTLGVVILISLIVLVTINDLRRLIGPINFWERLQPILPF